MTYGAAPPVLKAAPGVRRVSGVRLGRYALGGAALDLALFILLEHSTRLNRERIKVGGRDKVLTLCHASLKTQAGLWSPPSTLRQILHGSVEWLALRLRQSREATRQCSKTNLVALLIIEPFRGTGRMRWQDASGAGCGTRPRTTPDCRRDTTDSARGRSRR